jgi:hypothetical protein
MLVYNYDPDSREFVDASEADADPLTPGEFLIPAHATTIAPPDAHSFETPFFDLERNAWTLVDVSYRLADNVLRVVATRLAGIGPLFDAYSDLAALGELDDDGLDYLQALRLYRARLRQVHQQPGFPQHAVMPEAPPLRDVPRDPLKLERETGR